MSEVRYQDAQESRLVKLPKLELPALSGIKGWLLRVLIKPVLPELFRWVRASLARLEEQLPEYIESTFDLLYKWVDELEKEFS